MCATVNEHLGGCPLGIHQEHLGLNRPNLQQLSLSLSSGRWLKPWGRAETQADQNCMRTASAARAVALCWVLFASVAFFASACFGQRFDPVHCSLRSDVQRVRPGDPIALQLTATIEPGWHLYSLTTPEGGPTRTTAVLEGGTLQSAALYEPAPERRFDPSFNLDTEIFSGQVILLVSGTVVPTYTQSGLDLIADLRYQACNDRLCLRPKKKARP